MAKIKKIEKIKLPYDGEPLEIIGLSHIFALEEKLNEIVEAINKSESEGS